MRGLRLFGWLCAGVVVLVACWLTAFATLAAMMLLDSGAGWALLGIPLVPVLLVAGIGLETVFEDELEPGSRPGPTGNAVLAFLFAACAALFGAGSVLYFSGAQIYHVHQGGERTEAVVSTIMEINGDSSGVVSRRYYVRDSVTGESLGPLAVPPKGGVAEGDPIAVSVDPRGRVRPVPADSTGWTTVPAVILLGCAGVVALGALGVLATGLVELATRRPR